MQEIELPPRDRYLHYIRIGPEHDTISWSFSTQKKSIGFGLFKQLSSSASSHNLNSIYESASHDSINKTYDSARRTGSLSSGSKGHKHLSLTSWPSKGENQTNGVSSDTASIKSHSDNELLKVDEVIGKKSITLALSPLNKNKQKVLKSELIEILPIKTVDASKTTVKGQVHIDLPGTYILYFDNSHSWNTSKKLTFFVNTFKEKKKPIPELPTIAGWLLKKKRKKMQGWAKRWCFIKDGVLSYAKDENSIVRGSINVIHSVTTFDTGTLMLFIDSGSNFFRFKFLSEDDFRSWEKVIIYYLESDDPIKPIHVGMLEEIPESESESIVSPTNAISRSLSIRKSMMDNNHNGLLMAVTQDNSSELKACIERLFDDIDALSNQLGPMSMAKESPSNESIKPEQVKESPKDTKINFFSFRAKRDATRLSPQTQATLLESSACESVKHKLAELRESKSNILDRVEQEAQQLQKLQLAYIDLVGQLNQPKNRSEGNELGAIGSSISFHQDTFNSGSKHSRRRSVYSRRQNSIMSLSSLGNNDDEFFDALEGEEMIYTFTSDQEDDMNEDIIVDDSSDDDSMTPPQQEEPSSVPPYQEPELGLVQSKEINLVDFVRRAKLPSPVCGEEVSFLSILRKNVGKDLATVTLPISLNEPLNILQRLCEELEYYELLNKAASCQDSIERLIYIVAFAISPYAASGQRASRKPFNPLLGETYECVREDKGFKFISEKVSHTPPIFGCYAESNHFEFYQESQPKSKFWGKSMELIPSGTVHVNLKPSNDHFTFNKATGWMRNLVAGNKYLEYSGELIITNWTTGEYCKLQFKESTFFSSSNNEVKASIYTKDNKLVHTLEGQWSHSLMWNKGNDQLEVIYRTNPPISNPDQMYNFTQFAIELNEITPDLPSYLPITDTRYRPDQSLFEKGDVNTAESEKNRVEELQRSNRKARELQNIQYQPKWFERKPNVTFEGNKCDMWTYNGKYFQARDQKQFGDLPNLW